VARFSYLNPDLVQTSPLPHGKISKKMSRFAVGVRGITQSLAEKARVSAIFLLFVSDLEMQAMVCPLSTLAYLRA
jgi:hypothetical protein